MTLAILLIGLVIATCFIAYIADNIGKNMGKKRVSLFGLRPRQTATLISMASSVLIMLATVGILMATSQSLSNALLRYDAEKAKANREKTELLQANQGLQTNLSEQRSLIKNQKREIEQNRAVFQNISAQRKTAETNFRAASARLKTARAGETKARAQTKQAQTQLASARRQFQTFQAQLKAAKAQVVAAKSRVENAQSQVARAQTQLRKEQQNVQTTQQKFNAAQGKLSSAQATLKSAQNDLEDAQEKQKVAQGQLQQVQINLQQAQKAVDANLKDLEKAANEVAQLETQRADLEKVLETQRSELARLEAESKGYLEIAKSYREIAKRISVGDIAIPQGEVFAERTVSANLSAAQMREALRALVKAGREQLADPPRTLSLAVPKEAESLSEDEFLNGFAAYLSTQGVPVSLRLLSSRDHARGETQIEAYILPIVISTVFKNDEVLGTATIESGSDAGVFNQLLKLLNETEQRARERGVTPLPTREDPLFYPTGTNERVFEALRQIQSEGGTAKVNLIAAEGISSVDSPRVRFEIVPQTSP